MKRNGFLSTITVPFILTTTKVNEAAESSRFYQIIPPGLSGLRSMQQRWERATVVLKYGRWRLSTTRSYRYGHTDTRSEQQRRESPIGGSAAGGGLRPRDATATVYNGCLFVWGYGGTQPYGARVAPATVDHAASQKLCKPCLVSTPPG